MNRQLPRTVPHIFDFGDDRVVVGDNLLRPEAWDALRTRTDGAFSLHSDRETWQRSALDRTDIVDRADAVAQWLDAQGINHVASYGVGVAYFEYLLWRWRPIPLTLGDYTPAAITQLGELFPEAQVRHHDLRVDAPFSAELHIFHRVDTEFTHREWRSIFRRFADSRVLFIASELADKERLRNGRKGRKKHPHATRAGWLRNEAAMTRLWGRHHRATRHTFGDLVGWDLVPR